MKKTKKKDYKPLLTLLVDKINNRGYMMGAHHNKNWYTNTNFPYRR